MDQRGPTIGLTFERVIRLGFTRIWQRLDRGDAKYTEHPGKPRAHGETEFDAAVPQRQRAEMSVGCPQET